MDSMTTTILSEATNQYNKGGINSAGGYILVVIGVLFVVGTIFYVKKNMKINEKNIDNLNKERETEKKESKELQDKLFKMFEESINRQYTEMSTMNKEIINEVKSISDSIRDGMNGIVENNLKANEMLYAVIESSNDKVLNAIEERKCLRVEDYEKQVKLLNENHLFKLKDSLESRISRNNLVELKDVIAQEIDGMIENMACEFKESIKDIKYPNEAIITKFHVKYDSIIVDFKSDIIKLFDVKDNYNKDNLLRAVKSDVYKCINKISILNFNVL